MNENQRYWKIDTHRTDWDNRVDEAIADLHDKHLSVREFIERVGLIRNDVLRVEAKEREEAKLAAMRPEERAHYWDGYNDDGWGRRRCCW